MLRLYTTTIAERATELLSTGFNELHDGGHPWIPFDLPLRVLFTWEPLDSGDGWPDKIINPVRDDWPADMRIKVGSGDLRRAVVAIDFPTDVSSYEIECATDPEGPPKHTPDPRRGQPTGEYYIPYDVVNANLSHGVVYVASTEAELMKKLDHDEILQQRRRASREKGNTQRRTWQRDDFRFMRVP